MIAMEGAEKREEKVTSGQIHTHNTRPFSKTHLLILVMKKADKERNMLILVKTYTHAKHKTIQ